MSYDLVIVISDLGGGGTQRVVSQLIQHWSRDKKIAIITLSNEKYDFFKVPKSVDRHSISGIKNSKNKIAGLFENVSRIRKLRNIFKEIKPKCIVSFLSSTNILTVLAAGGLNTKVVISERNDPARQSLGFVWNMLRRRYYHQADVVTANTQAAIDAMTDYVPKNKLRYIQNPIAEAPTEDSYQFDHPILLAVGRLYPQKAYDVLLEAFAKFHGEYPEWHLVILGEGPLKETLQKQANDLGISQCVNWCGEVKNPFPYYRAAKFFVMPSRHEGMPNALLEAINSGLSVVISDALPGPLEYIENNVSGLVVPVENAIALAQALSQMAGNEKLRKRLALAAADRIKSHAMDAVISNWNSVLEL